MDFFNFIIIVKIVKIVRGGGRRFFIRPICLDSSSKKAEDKDKKEKSGKNDRDRFKNAGILTDIITGLSKTSSF